MKTTKLNLLALLLLAVLSTTVTGLARGRRPGDNRPGRREVSAYLASNVLPVLRQQRQKLEPQLSPADRTQLATYRTQLRALREQGRALHHSVNPGGERPTTRPALTEAQQQQAHELRAQTRGIMLSVAQLAQKYEGAIAQLGQEVQPQQQQWRTDIQAIVAKNANTGPAQPLAMAPAPGRRPGGPGGRHHFFRPATFLLLDPTAPAANAAAPGMGSLSFYPNPVAATSQLEYDVKKAGSVTVDLLDKDGHKLRTLLAEPNAEQGPHRQQLDLSALPAGTYFYQITTNGSSQTKRFVKE